MTVDVQSEIIIDQPPSRVATYAANPDNAPDWTALVDAVQWLTPRPLTLGTKVLIVDRSSGRPVEHTAEVVALEIGERLVMRSEDAPVSQETIYRWEPAGKNATRMIIQRRRDPPEIYREAAPLMELALQRTNQKDLERLKALLEG